ASGTYERPDPAGPLRVVDSDHGTSFRDSGSAPPVLPRRPPRGRLVLGGRRRRSLAAYGGTAGRRHPRGAWDLIARVRHVPRRGPTTAPRGGRTTWHTTRMAPPEC